MKISKRITRIDKKIIKKKQIIAENFCALILWQWQDRNVLARKRPVTLYKLIFHKIVVLIISGINLQLNFLNTKNILRCTDPGYLPNKPFKARGKFIAYH